MGKKIRQKLYVYKNAYDMGRALGLTDFEMQIITQKKRIIEKLRAVREKQGISQALLAKMVASQQPAIARMESGLVTEVSLDFLCKVALALGVTVTIGAKVA
ncbi:MAG: helix-turn-helix transcriptional regulator [Bdellovibrionota bacterium]